MKFESFADLANMGAHLDVAADQTSFIKYDSLDAKQFDNSEEQFAPYSSRSAKTKLYLWFSLVPRRFGLEVWRALTEGYKGKGGHRAAALLTGILNPRAR